MAFILVTMKLQNIPGKRMGYPKAYNPSQVLYNPVYEGAFARGEKEEKCLVCVRDEVVTEWAADSEGRMEIVTEAQADAWLAANKQIADMAEEQVTDSNRIMAILAKKAADIPLSQDDKDAVDPDKPTKGIRRKKKTCKDFFNV